MTIDEVILGRQITLNNNWPEITDIETEAMNYVRERLADRGLKQILATVKIDKTTAFAALVSDKQLAKIFSSFLDVYDSLPYHPDLAFDAAWRSLEYTIRVYADRAWGYKEDKPLHDIFRKISSEVVESLINKEADLKDTFEYLVSNTSISAARYTTVRLFYAKQLSVAPQIKFVRERIEKVLSKDMLEVIKKVYMDEEGRMDTNNVIDVARRLVRLLNGQDIQIGETSYKPIPLCDRIELLISGILYTSRCERFHGDIYSPLKSSKTTLLTYYDYYFLTLTSMFFFWATFYKLIERNGDDQCIKFSNLKESVITTIDRMNDILSNKQKQPMFERAKFHSLHDLGNTVKLLRVQKVLDAYNPGLNYDNVNDVQEIYNAKLFIDNGFALKAWDDTTQQLMKIDEDLSINAFLNAQLENNNGADIHIMMPRQQYG